MFVNYKTPLGTLKTREVMSEEIVVWMLNIEKLLPNCIAGLECFAKSRDVPIRFFLIPIPIRVFQYLVSADTESRSDTCP